MFEDHKSYINLIAGLMMASIIFFLIGSVILRKKLLDNAINVDANATTPSDFALLGDCPYFDENNDLSKEMVEQEVNTYLSKEFDINGIEYCNVALDIHDIYDVIQEHEANLKQRSLL